MCIGCFLAGDFSQSRVHLSMDGGLLAYMFLELTAAYEKGFLAVTVIFINSGWFGFPKMSVWHVGTDSDMGELLEMMMASANFDSFSRVSR